MASACIVQDLIFVSEGDRNKGFEFIQKFQIWGMRMSALEHDYANTWPSIDWFRDILTNTPSSLYAKHQALVTTDHPRKYKRVAATCVM
jgi:hypothetical protein